MKKVKKWVLSIGFFSYITWGIPFIGKSSGCTYIQLSGNLRQIYIAKNVTFEGCLGPNFCPIWVKNG